MSLPPTRRATYIPLHFTRKAILSTIWRLPIWVCTSGCVPIPTEKILFVEFRKDMREQLMIGNFLSWRYAPDDRLSGTRQLKEPRNDLYTYLSVAVFFLMNAFLAVLGTFWFRTQQRRSELGLRVALGGTRVSLRRLLWGEGVSLLLTLAFIPAIVVASKLGIGGNCIRLSGRVHLASAFCCRYVRYHYIYCWLFTVFLAVWLPCPAGNEVSNRRKHCVKSKKIKLYICVAFKIIAYICAHNRETTQLCNFYDPTTIIITHFCFLLFTAFLDR